MKILNLLILAAITFLAASCYEDLGNYTYTEREEITVKGIGASYDKISYSDRIILDPEVTSTDPSAAFEYFWGIYETNVQGSVPKVDTLAKTKAIDYLVIQPAKGWVLVFGAKNKNTGLSKIVTSNINVITPFTRGWYVLKDNGTQADFDLFLTPASILPDGKKENVFSEINKKKLTGKASLFAFFVDYKSMVTGALGNTRALFALTDNDATVVDINTLKEIRGFGTLFYETPAIKKPGAVFLGSAANFFINNGKLHSIYAMSSNYGMFGYPQMRDANNSASTLSKFFATTYTINPLLFDETSSSFISAGGAGTQMNAVTDQTGTAMPSNKNNKTLLFMGLARTSPFTVYAVFQDKTNASQKILSTITGSSSAVKLVNDTLKTTDKIYNGMYHSINLDETLIYFAVGNEVWSRNMSNRFEQLQYTIPAGETITFIRHRKYTGTGTEAPYAYNYILIGSKSGTSYKVRMFTKTAGNLASAPAVTMEGTGSVGDVIYIAPGVSGYTYQNTF